MRAISGLAGIFTRIHDGLVGRLTVGITFTGIRATLSAPRSFSPRTTFLISGLVSMSDSKINSIVGVRSKLLAQRNQDSQTARRSTAVPALQRRARGRADPASARPADR